MSRRTLVAFAFLLVAWAGPLDAVNPDLGIAPQDLIPAGKYEFEFKGLDDTGARGVFRFKWKGDGNLTFSTYAPQKGSTFVPAWADFYFWTKSGWREAPNQAWCGTGRQSQIVVPNRDYFILIDLTSLAADMRRALSPGAEEMVVALGAEDGPHSSGFVISGQMPLSK